MDYYVRDHREYNGYSLVTETLAGDRLKKARRKYEHVRQIHRTIRRAFAGGVSLVLAQFPFSLLGSEALHVSTSALGGVLVIIPGFMLAFHYGTGDGMPNLNKAQEEYEEASDMYTRAILKGGNDVG